MSIVIEAVLVGMVALLVATVPRNLVFAANLNYFSSVPWAVPLIALYLWFFWRYLGGWGVEPRIEVVARYDAREKLYDADDVRLSDFGNAGHRGRRQRDRGHVRLRHEHLDVSSACVGANGREELRLRLQRDIDAQRVAGTHTDRAFHRPVAKQAHPQRVLPDRHPLENKEPFGAGRRAEPGSEDRDRRP